MARGWVSDGPGLLTVLRQFAWIQRLRRNVGDESGSYPSTASKLSDAGGVDAGSIGTVLGGGVVAGADVDDDGALDAGSDPGGTDAAGVTVGVTITAVATG